MIVVYFSSTSEMTTRFVNKLGVDSRRIPLRKTDLPLEVDEDYVLIVPSYGAGARSNAVPKQVITFLNNPENRTHLVGVIGSGNTNYGAKYCLGARVVAQKCNVPLLYTYELIGLPEDVTAVQTIIKELDEKPH